MPMNTAQLTEEINTIINQALASGMPFATISSTLSAQATALTTAAPTHDRTIQDPGPGLNPSQPD